jgi:hypothetical protein
MNRPISQQEVQALANLSSEVGVSELLHACAVIISGTEKDEEFVDHIVCKLMSLSKLIKEGSENFKNKD